MTSKAREALNAVVDCAFDGKLKITETAFEMVLEALKEPVRNCDLYTSSGDASDAYYEENPNSDMLLDDEFHDWLFSEAKTKIKVKSKRRRSRK